MTLPVPPHPDEACYLQPWEYQYARAQWWRVIAMRLNALNKNYFATNYISELIALRKAIRDAK